VSPPRTDKTVKSWLAAAAVLEAEAVPFTPSWDDWIVRSPLSGKASRTATIEVT
jgi:hypothetical protein